MFIEPIWIEPLFNQVRAAHAIIMPTWSRRSSASCIAAAWTFRRERMFEMKASEKTTELNAYVTGFGATKRVVVWDTTMEHMNTGQTLFVFGHEMGHYVLHHIPKEMTIILLHLLVLFIWAFGWRTGWWRATARDGAYAT